MAEYNSSKLKRNTSSRNLLHLNIEKAKKHKKVSDEPIFGDSKQFTFPICTSSSSKDLIGNTPCENKNEKIDKIINQMKQDTPHETSEQNKSENKNEKIDETTNQFKHDTPHETSEQNKKMEIHQDVETQVSSDELEDDLTDYDSIESYSIGTDSPFDVSDSMFTSDSESELSTDSEKVI